MVCALKPLWGAQWSWTVALNRPGASQMQYAKKLLLSRPYFSRIPDQSLIVGLQGEGEHHVSATRAQDGSYAMVYLPNGQDITVDLGQISGSEVIGWWFDPTTGRAKQINQKLATRQRTVFKPPSAGLKRDWILVLDDSARHFAAPGVITRSH